MRKNQVRDRANITLLEANGWQVLTIWQCELKNTKELKEKLYEFIEKN